MSVATGNAITQAALDDLATLANAKLSPGTAYAFVDGATDFLTELQRIRTDLLDAIDADPAAAEFRISPPQVVGINPTFAVGEHGRLYFGSASTVVPATDYLPLFRSVEFWYALIDGPTIDDPVDIDDEDVSIDFEPPIIRHELKFEQANVTNVEWTETVQTATGWTPPPLTAPERTIYDAPYTLNYTQNFDLPAAASASVRLIIPLVWQGEGSAPVPSQSNFAITSPTGLAAAIEANGDGWQIRIAGDFDLSSGVTAANYTLTSTTGWLFGEAVNSTPVGAGDPGTTWPSTPSTARGDESTVTVDDLTILTLAEGTTRSTVPVIHPGSAGRKVTIADVADVPSYTLNTARGIDYLELSTRNIRGIWIARTLPSPAVNSFVDQDIPPYVQRIVNYALPYYLTADLTTSTLGVPAASSLRGRLVPDEQNPPAYYEVASAMKQGAPYYPHEDETKVETETNYPTFASGQTISGTLLFPYWLHEPWTDFPYPFLTQAFLTVVTAATAPTLTIYVSDSPGIDPANPATYDFTVNDVGTGGTLAEVPLDLIVTELGPLSRTIYYVIKNTGAASVFAVVSTTTYPDEKQIRSVTPSIEAQPAVWPVIRDTDDYPWFDQLDPFRALWTIGTATVEPAADYQFSRVIGETYGQLHAGQRNWKISVSPALPIYVSMTGYPDPDDAETFEIEAIGELTMAMFEDAYGVGTFGEFFVTVRNNTAEAVALTAEGRNEETLQKFQRRPVFFPTNEHSDNPDELLDGVAEHFSYKLISSAYGGGAKMIPRRGYAIYSVLVRRLPVAIDPESEYPIYLPPTTGLTELTVRIGQFENLRHTQFEDINKGTFVELTSVTIPEGELEARVDVFWPVLAGACLVYQASTAVKVEALVNWQPIFHSTQYAGAPIQGNDLVTQILPADALRLDQVNRFDNAFYPDHPVQFPMSAAVYNELTDALNLL